MADSSQPEMPRKATKKKKNHYTKQKQEEAEDERSNITEEDAPSRPEMKPQDMSITEKKRLTCFFYYGGERRVLPSGTFHYFGGVSEAMMIEDDMTKGELLSRIGSRLKISLHNKLIFHNTKRDKIKYLRVKDDNGVKMMFYLNEDEVDVFVDEDPFDASSRESNIVESNKTPREKKHLTCICYWNGIRTVLPDGTFNYSRGASEAVLIEDGMSYNELLSKICSCLEIPTYDKVVFYNFKRDKTKYLRVKDDNGVEMLFHMNEEEVDVFVEEEPSSRDSGCDYNPAILGEANGCMHRGVGEANGCMHRGVDEANGCMHRGVGEANGCMHRGVGEANGCMHRGVDEGSAQLFCMILLLLVLVFVLFQL